MDSFLCTGSDAPSHSLSRFNRLVSTPTHFTDLFLLSYTTLSLLFLLLPLSYIRPFSSPPHLHPLHPHPHPHPPLNGPMLVGGKIQVLLWSCLSRGHLGASELTSCAINFVTSCVVMKMQIPTICALSATAISSWTVFMHLRHYKKPLLQRNCIRILIMYVQSTLINSIICSISFVIHHSSYKGFRYTR